MVQHAPQLAQAQEAAQWLINKNQDYPDNCAKIQERLNSVQIPVNRVLVDLEDKLKTLKNINIAIETYHRERRPVEDFIFAAEQQVDEMEPFGLDLVAGESQVKQLDVSV